MKLQSGILIAALVAACSPAVPRQIHVTPPPPTPVVKPQAEPVPSPVGTNLQQNSRMDPVGLAIMEARTRFDRGQELYKAGFLKRAKEEFDGALDLLLDTASLYPKNGRLDVEVADLADKIHTLELAAFKDGDGFTDQKQEHAAIDDLENITTFPTPIDPKFKREVEKDLASIPHDLPIEINDRVLNFLDYYQKGRGRTTIEIGLERVGKYQLMIERIMAEEGVPLDLIYLCQAESAFIPRALSRAKAKGMWQFISSRGKEYGLRQNWWIDERSDPEKSTRAAARHLKDLYEEFNDWYLAMAAYNAGPYRVQRAIDKTGQTDFWKLVEKRALPKETMNYVPTILALTIINKNPEKYGFSVSPAPALEVERVSVDKATDLRVIAESIHVSVDDLKDLNPHVLRWTTPPSDPEFELILPKGYSETFHQQMAALPDEKRVLFRYHTVQRSETLSMVARKYGTTVAALTQANNLAPKKPLRLGQELIIPISGVGPTSIATASKTTPQRSISTATRHTVKPGDTLTNISKRYSISVNQLKDWNDLSSTNLSIGTKLIVAKPESAKADSPSTVRRIIHKVRPGETLDKIAVAYKTTVGAILSWNKKNDLTVLHPGDQLTIFPGNR